MLSPRERRDTDWVPEEEDRSFDALYRRYARRVTRWAQRLGGPDIEPEEALQEVFLIVNRRLPNFADEQHAVAWLFQVTTRVVSNQRRSWRRRWSRRTSLSSRMVDETTSNAPSPADLLERREAAERFYRVLGQLPEKHRSVLVLFELENMSTEQIAATINRPPARDRQSVVASGARLVCKTLAVRSGRNGRGHRNFWTCRGQAMSGHFSDRHSDPPRWRDARDTVEGSLAEHLRKLPEPRDVDDVRIAQIRQHIVENSSGIGRPGSKPDWSLLRTTVFAALFLVLGGLATALAAPYVRILQKTWGKAMGRNDGSHQPAPRSQARRWKVSIREPAALEISIDGAQAQFSIIEGRAEITGTSSANPVLLTPGRPFQDSLHEAAAQLFPESRETAADKPAPPDTSLSALIAKAAPATQLVSPPPPAPAAPIALRQLGRRPLVDAAPRVATGGGTDDAALRLARADADRLLERPSESTPAAAVSDSAPLQPPSFDSLTAPALDRGLAADPDGSPRRVASRRSIVPDGAAEAFVVADALRSLRVDGAPAQALAKLDEHQRRFPNGVLQREAALARVEALLKLERQAPALEVLDSLTLAANGADRHVLLARAELRADAQRCVEAQKDLNLLVAGRGADDDTAARALYRRARCSVRLRDLPHARADLLDYIRRFPEGAHRRDVEALLGSLPSSAGEAAPLQGAR